MALNRCSPDSFTDNHHKTSLSSSFSDALGFAVPLSSWTSLQVKLNISSRQSWAANPRLQSSAHPHTIAGRDSPQRTHHSLKESFLLVTFMPRLSTQVCTEVNEVVWLMDTNRCCFFDLQNEFQCDWLKLKYANAQWTSCLFISVYACRPISNFFLVFF